MDIPFFSNHDRIGMMLIEIRRPEEVEARSKFLVVVDERRISRLGLSSTDNRA